MGRYIWTLRYVVFIGGLVVVVGGIVNAVPSVICVGAALISLPAFFEYADSARPQRSSAPDSEQRIAALRERYVAGEIDVEQFERSVAYLLAEDRGEAVKVNRRLGRAYVPIGENADGEMEHAELLFPCPPMERLDR